MIETVYPFTWQRKAPVLRLCGIMPALRPIRLWRIVSQVFTFIESSIFERIRSVYLDDDEYSELQQYLMQNPEAGELIPRSGGIRKARWTRAGMGKRGGLRVIYYERYRPNEFWMLTLYAKASRESVPAHILRQLLEVFRDD